MDIIQKYFPHLSAMQQQQFAQMEEVYRYWNEKINVISRKDIDLLYERHVLHSLGIAKVISFKPETILLDVGTGGGFPGIPLAILYPKAHFHLIDAIGKKIKVVNEVIQTLRLSNVKAEQKRAETVSARYYDFIVSRAVTRSKPFFEWVWNKVSKNSFNTLDNGILHLKGGDLTEELKELKRKHRVFHLSDFFEESFFETKKVVYLPMGKK
ncbi:MAG: 16S rRNA (guanine(527)-N(7))-methyltransferase RsmG [Thermonemataceae bacterium]